MSASGVTTVKVLNALDALDRHSFERMDGNNSLDTLYGKIFMPPGTKEPTGCANNSNNQEEQRETRTEYVSYCRNLF